jgi:type VII secretion effector (TIGR04197 family)
MSNNKITIKPEALDGEISAVKSALTELKNVKYEVETKRTILTSIDKYKESVSLLNEAFQNFSSLLDSDVKNLELIKAEWLNLDKNKIAKIFED